MKRYVTRADSNSIRGMGPLIVKRMKEPEKYLRGKKAMKKKTPKIAPFMWKNISKYAHLFAKK